VFDKLPADQQKAVKQAALNAMKRSFKQSETHDKEALEFAKQKKLKVITLSDAELARFRAKLLPLYDAMAKKSPEAAKLVAILKAHLKIK
jgi:TRAP-type C4-dicarboxylate transport system substrate-binding protein